MSDGSQLRQTWYSALNDAEAHFRQLLTSTSSSEWRRVSNSSETSPGKKGKARVTSVPELGDVIVHRKSGKAGEDIYRLMLEVQGGEELATLEPWKAILMTPELRQEWDPAVEEAHLLEVFDRNTRICKTNYTLGWPANPRDAVTISRSFHDSTTLIDISTSLPRSPDEPAYLRPSPPFVRSDVKLFAWCIQIIQPPPIASEEQSKKKLLPANKIRITCFWQHDLKALWGFTSSSGLTQQMSTMTLSLLKTVMKRGGRVPTLTGYGNGVSIERIRYQIDRAALTVDYSIIPEDDDHTHNEQLQEVQALREHRRLTRSIECVLPASEGWDVQVSVKASSEEVEQLPWSGHAIRSSSNSSVSGSQPSQPDQIVLRLSHAALADDHSVLKVKVVIEISGGTRGLRLNGLPKRIHDVEEERDPSSYTIPQKIFQDVMSTADLSFQTTSSMGTTNSNSSNVSSAQTLTRPTERSAAADKSILSRVRRNYIYFSSLLQEPEAKWRRTTEARGVSITQLDSIDPTLVVYRAEATFVGVGLWDLYGAVVSPGARSYWDKQHEDAVLLEDVSELTELWHFKTKPAWPVTGRDAVLLKTVYKSPTTIHVFSFSADDPHLFPNIPPVDPSVIRTQVDLQGWAIEALSPTTTLLTLLEQSDPKGWTNKTAIPTQMINMLAGIGEFTIKCGGPPVVTRLSGAKANELRYDHERLSFRIEYEASANRTPPPSNEGDEIVISSLPKIECELRCDVDTWAGSLDIVVDPPPQTITCLRRHRLSAEGGGLWVTLTHDSVFIDEDRLLAIVRRAPGKERGLVMVNGAKVQVDVEELPEHEIKTLTKMKRVKPPRIPLDQPPIMGAIRKRKAEWGVSDNSEAGHDSAVSSTASGSVWASAPQISSPLARFLTYAVDQATTTTQQAVAAISPASVAGSAAPSPHKHPMQYALEALSWAQEFSTHPISEGWTLISDKGMSTHRKMAPEISPVVPVHQGFKVMEGVSAEELVSVVEEYDCRKVWDDRFDSAKVLQSYGSGCRTTFLVSKSGFPFRDRGFYLASVVARGHVQSPLSKRSNGDDQSNESRNAIFCVSASFSADSVASFDPMKYNPYQLPIGRVYVDAWILETLDPYTKENYAIPSTRCTRLVAVDYAGSIPAAVNSMINAGLSRSILAVEAYIKGISPLPITRLPTPGLVIVDRKGHEHLMVSAWKLRKRDDSRVLINSRYKAEVMVYMTLVYVTLPPEAGSRPGRVVQSKSPHMRSLSGQVGVDVELGSIGSGNSDVTATPSNDFMPGSPPRGVRQRMGSLNGEVTSRGRQSSTFTLKGEVKPLTDLLVAELVIDSKLYPGGYEVKLRSRMRSSAKTGLKGQFIPLVPQVPSTQEGDKSPMGVLPMIYNIYTMPSSPLHSSGINAESPTRHLLRLTLPTAQYLISTITDPLTGETQVAPPKPAWMIELQQEGGGALVDIEVRPITTTSQNGKGAKKDVAIVDGREVIIIGEKESLTALGREELLEDRTSRMSVLTRIPDEAEPMPDDLRVPISIADDLLDSSSTGPSTHDSNVNDEEQAPPPSEGSEDSPGGMQPKPEAPTIANSPQAPGSSHGGLLGFLHAYPNPLTRFTSVASIASTTSSNGSAGSNAAPPSPTPSAKVPGHLGDVDGVTQGAVQMQRKARTGVYPISTVLIVALIAFLVGSLLRSLLSPADFIYVVTDVEEVAGKPEGGWREIRRLVELKYVFGGWDLQVAAVRRH